MKTRISTYTILTLALLIVLATSSAWAAESKQMELARELVKTAFPKDLTIKMCIQKIPEQYRENIQKVMPKYFGYSKVVEPVAKEYAAIFSSDELTALIAYYKKESTQIAIQRIEHSPASKELEEIAFSPPGDTLDTRREEAMRFAAS